MESNHQQVLLVDDDPMTLRVLSQSLELAGYEVRTASDGHEAMDMIRADCPHFLVTDWEMPRMSGEELCRRVRMESLPHYIYIVFLTGHGGSDHTIRGLDAGADDFLTKPVARSELLARLKSGQRVLALERRLSEMARTDPLTGIPTRRAFYEQFEREMNRARRYRLPLSCVMIDIDYFKKVNDQHGHPAGDAAIKAVAHLLETSIRASDYLCRYGGEEFCVLLAETTDIAAGVWAERVRKAISQLTVPIRDQNLRLTASFGLSQLLDDVKEPSEVIDQADQALLVAKQSGRDRVVSYRSLCDASELPFAAGMGDPFTGIQARNVMTTLVSCLEQNETVGHAADFFLRFRINSSPVVDENGKLVGVLSEKDVMSVMLSPDCWHRPIRQVMKTNVVCYQEDTPIKAIYDFLCRVTIRRVIIVNDGYPTGLISRGTLLRWFNNWQTVYGEREVPDASNEERQRRRASLKHASAALLNLSERLYQHLSGDDESVLPALVDSSSRMQELINDMLSDSRSFLELPQGEPSGSSRDWSPEAETVELQTLGGAQALLAAQGLAGTEELAKSP
jgi:diguanylate cyclase (GGDEF)-like protein